jgi:hypothetical protein
VPELVDHAAVVVNWIVMSYPLSALVVATLVLTIAMENPVPL